MQIFGINSRKGVTLQLVKSFAVAEESVRITHSSQIGAKFTKDQWVEALRSGEFKQTSHILKDAKGHCCLGDVINHFL